MKKVTFNENINRIQNMVVWDFAYRQARRSNFESTVLDRIRFEARIKSTEELLKNIFHCNHRCKIYNSRFK